MSVKARKKKKQKMQELYDNSVKIKCCFCSIKQECPTRAYKEKSESLGIITYCTLTPNRTKKFIKNKKRGENYENSF